MKYLNLIIKNALRNRRRTILTTLAVASCMFLLTSIRTLLYSMEDASISGSSKFRIISQHAASLANFLPEAHRDKIAAIPDVKAIVGGDWYGGIYIDEKPEHFFGQMAVDKEGFREMFDDYKFLSGYEDWQKVGRVFSPAGKSLKNSNGRSGTGSRSKARSSPPTWKSRSAVSCRGLTRPRFTSTGNISRS